MKVFNQVTLSVMVMVMFIGSYEREKNQMKGGNGQGERGRREK